MTYDEALAAAVSEALAHPWPPVVRELRCPHCERKVGRVLQVAGELLFFTFEYDAAHTEARLETARYAERTGQSSARWRRPVVRPVYALLSHPGGPTELTGFCLRHGSVVLGSVVL